MWKLFWWKRHTRERISLTQYTKGLKGLSNPITYNRIEQQTVTLTLPIPCLSNGDTSMVPTWLPATSCRYNQTTTANHCLQWWPLCFRHVTDTASDWLQWSRGRGPGKHRHRSGKGFVRWVLFHSFVILGDYQIFVKDFMGLVKKIYVKYPITRNRNVHKKLANLKTDNFTLSSFLPNGFHPLQISGYIFLWPYHLMDAEIQVLQHTAALFYHILRAKYI